MSNDDESISIREFARRDGCSDRLVRDAIKSGYLKALPSGKLPARLVKTGWRRTNRRAEASAESPHGVRTLASAGAPQVDPEVRMETQPHGGALKRSRKTEPDRSEGADDDEADEGDGGHINIAEADRRKAVALARTRELDYDLRSGAVVPIDSVVVRVGAEYAKVRSRLLKIPVEQAPRLHRLKTPTEIQDALQEVITQALEELSCDEVSAPG